MTTELIHLTGPEGKIALVKDKIAAVSETRMRGIDNTAIRSRVYIDTTPEEGCEPPFNILETYEEVCEKVEGKDSINLNDEPPEEDKPVFSSRSLSHKYGGLSEKNFDDAKEVLRCNLPITIYEAGRVLRALISQGFILYRK